MKCTAIVLAAGQGKRMKSSVQKQFLQLGDYPVLYYSMKAFQDAPQITDIILVTGEQEIAYCQETFVERYQIDKVSAVVAGGKERYNSVYQGLCACQGTDYVLIHDGARPFVTEELIERGIDCAKTYKACAAGMPSKDTVKIVENDQKVASTPDRSRVWNVQTPQIFQYALVKEAYEQALSHDCSRITDDAMVVEAYGNHGVWLYEGSYKNIKITTPEDLEIGEIFAREIFGKKSKKNEKSVLTYWKTDDRISLVFERDKSADHYKDMERYRSGHNEAVLKTVCPKGRVGSNPTLSVTKEKTDRWIRHLEKYPSG